LSRCKPCPHLGVLMCCVVIDDQVDVPFSRHGVVDAYEETQKLLIMVSRLPAKRLKRYDFNINEWICI